MDEIINEIPVAIIRWEVENKQDQRKEMLFESLISIQWRRIFQGLPLKQLLSSHLRMIFG